MGVLNNLSNWLQNLHGKDEIEYAKSKTLDFGENVKKIQYKPNNKRCKHDPNSSCACCSTLNLVPRRIMSYPPVYQFICSECGQAFQFTTNDDGEYVSYTSSNIKG